MPNKTLFRSTNLPRCCRLKSRHLSSRFQVAKLGSWPCLSSLEALTHLGTSQMSRRTPCSKWCKRMAQCSVPPMLRTTSCKTKWSVAIQSKPTKLCNSWPRMGWRIMCRPSSQLKDCRIWALTWTAIVRGSSLSYPSPWLEAKWKPTRLWEPLETKLWISHPVPCLTLQEWLFCSLPLSRRNPSTKTTCKDSSLQPNCLTLIRWVLSPCNHSSTLVRILD